MGSDIKDLNSRLKRCVLIEKSPFWVRIIKSIPVSEWNYWYPQGGIYLVRTFKNEKDYNVPNSCFLYSELYCVIDRNATAHGAILKAHCEIINCK